MKTYPLQLTLQELTLLYISLSNRPLVTPEVMEQIQITIDLAKCEEKLESKTFNTRTIASYYIYITI